MKKAHARATALKAEVGSDVGGEMLVCGFANGREMTARWEVGDTHRPLRAVSRMVACGNCVRFDGEENGGSGVRNAAHSWFMFAMGS